MKELKMVRGNDPFKNERVLLSLMPFWDPQIPPLGLACLKSYLQKDGCHVKTVDTNLEMQFRECYDRYFHILDQTVPPGKKGNLYNIGNQVFRNHLMAQLNYTNKEKYIELVKILVYKTFYTDIDEGRVQEMNQVLDDFYSRFKAYFLDLLDREKPTVLGLSVYGDTLPASLAAFKWAKEKDPSIKTVMGGGIFADQAAPGSTNLEDLVEYTTDFIDIFIIGEGEELFLRFLRGELDETQRVFGLKDSGGRYVDISSLQVPDFFDFDLGYYPHLAFYGARSCPYQCKFCSETINWGKYRKKAVDQTVKGFIELYKRHSCQLFLMTDSTLNPTITPLSKAMIESGAAIYWDGFLRADRHVCNMDNTLLWRRGGFYRAKLGLESGSQDVLDLMNKQITVQQAEKALAALAYAGIKTTTFWLFGFPGETEENFQETLEFVEKCKDNIYEADCNAFNYYLTGQVNSGEWLKNNKGVLLYPAWAKDMLISQTWILEGEPSREESYQRVCRFLKHCEELGIPNPYSLEQICRADGRWKKLHKNAVPSLVDLKNKDNYINESQNIKKLSFAVNTMPEEGEEWL
ncbi:MAG: radical SAM protein [Candidatus Aminicenantes bacterium]|nr:radical SAM protein [Candidatus Aminicenantes bacterium]NIQ67777.1 radical SAM protein [Candidatus Aminicenantes bacterium]NIT23815.1 radical SAM protein [Candidatus Aminicenantes bacterium]